MPYAFNEGTNSAGEPAAGAPTGADDAPVEALPKRRGRPRKAAPTARGTGACAKTRDGTKQAQLIAMLRRKQGATIAQIVEATGWQPHTVRGAFAGALKKKLGLTVTSEKVEGKERVYRLPPEPGPTDIGDRRSEGGGFSFHCGCGVYAPCHLDEAGKAVIALKGNAMRRSIIPLSLLAVAVASATAGAGLAAPIAPKVLVITMFGPETAPWLEGRKLDTRVAVPGLSKEFPESPATPPASA